MSQPTIYPSPQAVGNPTAKSESSGSLTTTGEVEIDLSASFYVEFSHGYAFRNLIEYLRLTNCTGTFIFKPDAITYQQSNGAYTLLNDLTIDTCELTKYEMQSKTGQIFVTVNLSELRSYTRTIGKKDRATLSKMPNDPHLYLQVFSPSSTSTDNKPNLCAIPTLTPNVTKYTFADYKRSRRNPNCTVEQAEFAKMCTTIGSIKCSHVAVHGFENGALFKGISSSGTSVSFKEFGSRHDKGRDGLTERLASISNTINGKGNKVNIIQSNRPMPKLSLGEVGEIDHVNMPDKTIKNLAKLNNLSATGTIKIYIEPGLPLRLMCNVGTYGKLTVHIKSDD